MDSSKLKFSRMVRVITELPHPNPESNCNSFLKKLLMMGEFSTLNILELTCKWNSCFKSGEVVLPLQLQIEHQLAREHVQLQKLARDGLLKQSLHRSIACAYAMRLWSRSLSRSYCRLMAFFLATMIVTSGPGPQKCQPRRPWWEAHSCLRRHI